MKNLYNKILLWNEMANQLASYAVQQGNEKLMDYIDLNCGGIPQGPFEQVVDPEAPEQFLQMYTQIALNRFAFACTALLHMNQAYLPALKDYMKRTGEQMALPPVTNAQEAQNAFNSFYLDGNYKAAWEKAQGDVEVYHQLVQSFAQGLLGESGAEFIKNIF